MPTREARAKTKEAAQAQGKIRAEKGGRGVMASERVDYHDKRGLFLRAHVQPRRLCVHCLINVRSFVSVGMQARSTSAALTLKAFLVTSLSHVLESDRLK